MDSDRDARDRAGQLAQEIWLGIWPHTDTPKRPHVGHLDSDMPAPEYRLTPLQHIEEAKPGDLLWVMDLDGRDVRRERTLSTHTAREAVQLGTLARVESTTAKMIKVHDILVRPQGGYGGANLDALGDPAPGAYVVSMRFDTAGRLYARLGTVEEIRERLAAHPRYAEWQEAYAAAVVEHEAAEARGKAERDRRQARRAVLTAAIETVNSIAGEELVKLDSPWGEQDTARPANEWLAEGNHLNTYLAGLGASGKFDTRGRLEIGKALETLDLTPAGRERAARAKGAAQKEAARLIAEKERRRRDESAREHADAVWSDLCNEGPGAALRVAPVFPAGRSDVYRPPVALLFHHLSRDVNLGLTDSGTYRAAVLTGPNSGQAWEGDTAEDAVKAMCGALYGTSCEHGYTTGQDSCPGCDATAGDFEGIHPSRGAMPGPTPTLTRATEGEK
ncbi:hypothetical protein QFZ75_008012 [Streptomyces sp. V3I8]|uniref:hypothetical protein n=1 Tax=Streptomyces sp. V3I8 TaxID=3042279 RepID=UPI00278B9CFD|nr:hypothetical protein [Streptomyces sp. V3I8]MDQ1041510.1 hypothetical protein [Streptomyces sp. V3I8]